MDAFTVPRFVLRRLQGIVREQIYLTSDTDFTRPESIHGVVNQRCNFACQYCYSWQRTEYTEISIAQWQNALLSLRDYIGKYLIQFSGGEPFVKKGFIDLLTFCHSHEIEWGVITNGSAFNNKIVQRVVAADPVNIDISVDSSNAAINDDVRGSKGGLSNIEDGIQRLADERVKYNRRFLIRIKPTVTKKSFRFLPELVTWAAKHGADSIDFSPVRAEQFWTKKHYEELWLSSSDLKELNQIVQELLRLRDSGKRIETAPEKLIALVDHFHERKTFTGVSPCRVGMRDYFISPQGDVQVCWEYPSIGNVLTQSAKEIWEGTKAREIRAETVVCNKFGTMVCANSCLSHRTLRQEASRFVRIMAQGRTIADAVRPDGPS
jgi:radical SAM protein with 4Fe4S-binding SPASM domain